MGLSLADGLTALLGALSDPVCICQPTGELLWANGVFTELTQARPGQLVFSEPATPSVAHLFAGAPGGAEGVRCVVQSVAWQGAPALLFLAKPLRAPAADEAAEFKTLVETADDGIVKLSVAGVVTYANPRMQELTGLGVRALLELRFPDAFLPARREGVARAIEGAAAGVPTSVSGQLLSGKRVEVRLSPLETAGVVTSVLAIARDRETEWELELSQRRLALAMAATSDAIWEWNLETNQGFYSQRWYEMLGYGNRSFAMSLDTWKNLCHPEDLQPAQDAIAAAIAAPDNARYEVELRVRAADGGYRWILQRGAVVERDEAGKARILSGTNTDVTERKRAAAVLADNERRLRFVTDNVPTVMLYQVVIDAEEHRRFTYVSAGVERLHGLTADQALADASALYGQVHEDDWWLLRAAEQASRRELSDFEVEVRFRVAGSVRWALL